MLCVCDAGWRRHREKSYSRRSSRHVITKVSTIAEKHWHFSSFSYLTPIMLVHTLVAAVVISILISLHWLDALFYWITKEFRGWSGENWVVDRELDVSKSPSSPSGVCCGKSRSFESRRHLKCRIDWQASQPSLSRCLKSRLTLEGFLH